MIGSILLGVGCFALGGLVGFFVGMAVVAHAVANNVKGARDLMKKHIAEFEKLERAERAMGAMLAELKAKKGER
jgi:hypothetical protein